MKNRIYPPKHLSKPVQEEYKAIVKLMVGLKVYHKADNLLIEQLAVLTVHSRELQEGIATAEDPLRVVSVTGALSSKISQLSSKLGLDRSARPEHSRSLGRPTKQSGISAKPDEEEVWAKVLHFDDAKEKR